MNRISIVALFCFFLALLPAHTADSEDRPDFSGRWRLNTFISDDPIEKLNRAAREMMRSKRISSMGSPRMGYDRLGRRNAIRGREHEPPDPAEMERHLQGINLNANILEIAHDDPLLTIRYPNRLERSIFTDDRRQNVESGFGPVQIRARWKKKGRLVVSSKNDLGRNTTEKFELTMEGRQLQVVTNVEGYGPAPSFKFTRFYDRMPSEATETETDD
jgi:hypothetical protein